MKPTEIIGDCHLYLGDCRDILPHLPKVDLVLTDPPYGIGRDKGMGRGGNRFAEQKFYEGEWDNETPDKELFDSILKHGLEKIVWGGNYFTDCLPVSQRWLWWDKCQTMPSFSDGELAWTSFDGTSTKKFVYNWSGMMAKEKDRQHPTQKPIALMEWCIDLAPKTTSTVADPFMGSGTTGVACANMGKTFYGIEREPKYFDIACKRIEQAYAQGRLFA